MSRQYSEETRKILEDFLETLGRNKRVDAEFLAELRRMVGGGELGDATRIQQATAILEARADEL